MLPGFSVFKTNSNAKMLLRQAAKEEPRGL